LACEGIELQIDFEVFDTGKSLYEIFVLSDFQAIGIDHQMADWPGFGHRDNLEKIRVQCWLSTGDLYNVRIIFVTNDCIEHLFNEGKRPMFSAFRATSGVAHWAAQIARVGYFQKRQTRMLLMVGTEAAIIRTAPFDGRVVMNRHFGLLDENF